MKRLLLLLVAAPASLSLPGPARPTYTRGDRAAEDARCVACHGGIARDHERGLHAQAFSDASFQRGYRMEPIAFCRSCHAPESAPRDEPDAFARTRGVACVTCHMPDREILASGDGKRAPHPVRRVEDFGTKACVTCHDFAFPGAEARGEKGLMQKTAHEHDGARTCASCHMPKGQHRFAVSREPAMLSAALEVNAARTADGVTFLLTPRDVGHAFPTGDLFRRLVLRTKTARGTVETPFGRTFRAEGAVRFEVSDVRLRRPTEVRLPLHGAVTWEVVYQRITGVGQTPPFAVELEAEIVLAHGSL